MNDHQKFDVWDVSAGGWLLFQVPYSNSLRLGVGDFAAGAFADVSADIDDEDLVSHVDLAFVHVVKHGLGAFCPDLIVSAVTEQTDRDYDISFKRQSLLCFKIFLLELRAAAQGYYFVFADHGDVFMFSKLANICDFIAITIDF